jgi:hypothetical protein
MITDIQPHIPPFKHSGLTVFLVLGSGSDQQLPLNYQSSSSWRYAISHTDPDEQL